MARRSSQRKVQERLEKAKRFKAQQRRVELRERRRGAEWFEESRGKMGRPREIGDDEEMPDVPIGIGTVRETQPCLMGEGLGNNLGLDPPKYDTGWRVHRPEEVEDEIELTEDDEEVDLRTPAEKAKATRKANLKAAKKQAAREKRLVKEKRALRDARVFLVEWPEEDFEEKARALGKKIPVGVDVAHTEFGNLIIVPVIEEDLGKEMGLDTPRTDVQGRKFWITAEMMDLIEEIFGAPNWERPLTVDEAKQFGVNL